MESDGCCVLTGEELYGVIYSPEHVEEGVKVPAILYTYGGPVVQVRTCLIHMHATEVPTILYACLMSKMRLEQHLLKCSLEL